MGVFLRSLALLLPTGVLLPAALHGAVSPWQKNPHSEVRMITPYVMAPRHGEVRLGVHFRLARGWHAYWKNPGSAGYPPKFTFESPGMGDPLTLFPAPGRFELAGNLVAFGYAHEVVYPLRARLEAPEASSSLRLVADVDYLVCEVECVPYRYDLALEQPLDDTAVIESETAALLAAWEARVPRPISEVPGARAAAALEPGDPEMRQLLIDIAGVRAGEGAELFFESHPLFDFGRPAASPIPDGLRFSVPLVQLDRSRTLPDDTLFAWTLSGLDGGGSAALAGTSQVRLGGEKQPAPTARTQIRSAILWSSATLAAVAGALYALNRMRRA